jgi:pyrroloquinoline quinone biosynthesis protein B
MHAIVLGSAAGGGVPQWNCRCPICNLARAGDPRVVPRTQSSLAVSADGARWLLVNASPDVRQQIAATPDLHPRHGLRDTPIAAVLLTNGDVDHVAGLLSLRESQPFALYATDEILRALAANSVFNVLSSSCVTRTAITLDEPFSPVPGLEITLFAVPGKEPLWLERGEPEIGAATETTVGALVVGNGRRIAYVPGCARITDRLRERLRGMDALLFDGTVYADDDLIRAGVGTKTGWRMGHVPIAGAGGSLDALSDIDVPVRIYVHVNNTNPVLVEGAIERRTVEQAGWTVATDGMTLAL